MFHRGLSTAQGDIEVAREVGHQAVVLRLREERPCRDVGEDLHRVGGVLGEHGKAHSRGVVARADGEPTAEGRDGVCQLPGVAIPGPLGQVLRHQAL